jgi:signal transduction histidine kinase
MRMEAAAVGSGRRHDHRQGRRGLSLAVRIGAIQLIGTLFAAKEQVGEGRRALDVLAVVLLVAGPAALAFRERRPVAVLGFVLAATWLYYALDYPYGPAFLALAVAFYTAITRGHRVAAWVAAGVGYPSHLIAQQVSGHGQELTLAHAAALAAWLLVVLIGSEVVGARRERAAQEARSRQEEARRRASEERLRIARELHDVVAHNISLINVQAGVALHLLDEQPEQARSALSAIKQASKEALGELRSVLDVLRQDDEQAPRAPTTGLEDLEALVDKARAAGLEVDVQVQGSRRPLPSGVDLAAYRIVQESLTNVVRHAGPAAATVHLRFGSEALTVQVDDDGRGLAPGAPTAAAGGGNGIPGMRERVAALGGRLEAGPRAGGGFRVWAELPLNGDA